MSTLLDTASLIVTPNGAKSGKLYSVVPSSGAGDLDVTRATTATRVNSAGLVELVPYNLVEYSQDFSNAYWVGETGNTITSNTTTAPDGTLTADTFTATASNELNVHNLDGLTLANGTFTYSVYLKNNGTNLIEAYLFKIGIGFAARGEINFSAGTFTASIGTGSIENVGNGWFRVSLTNTYTSGFFTTGTYTTSTTGTRSVFAWGAQLVEGSTPKPYLQTTTRLNIPRLDYSNGSCPSILVEPQRTNVALYSEQFDNASWVKTNVNVTANSAVSPSGILNADKLIENSANSGHWIQGEVFVFSSTKYSVSIFAKASERNVIQLFLNGSITVDYANFDLINGVAYAYGSATASIQNLTNGWYRCSLIIDATLGVAPSVYYCLQNSISATRGQSYAGDGTSGLYIWGAQLEQGSYATSYIPTTSASVTRNADVISKTGIGSIFGSAYTIYGDFINQNVNNTRLLSLKIPSAGNYDNFITIFQNGTALAATGNNASSAEQFTITSGSFSLNQRLKFALRCQNNNVAFYINGTQIGVDTSCTIPEVTALFLGNYVDVFGVSVINSTAIWNTALTNTQLSQLTTL